MPRHDSSQRRGTGELLYLEDLELGQRFASGSHTLDEAQIRAFVAPQKTDVAKGPPGTS